jgi:hypothetical protein
MTQGIVMNVVLAVVVLAVILGMAAWAIVTHPRDRLALVGERRRAPDRRRRVVHPNVERRRGDRRYGDALTA